MNQAPLRYQITPKDTNAHVFQVCLTLDNPNPLGQVFSLPNWIPGSYLIRDFTKHIVSIHAHSCDKPVAIKKLDKNHWIAYPCADSLTLEYEIYAFDLSVRCAYLTNQRAFFNGSSVFLQPVGFENNTCEVQINYPTDEVLGDWACATSLTLKNKQKDAEIYTANNYLDLIDHPVEMSDFTRFEFNAGNIPHTMTITGEHSTDIDRLRADLMRICKHHIGFFGGSIPFDSYLFLTLATSKDYGGLEHKKSSSLICARKELPTLEQQEITSEYTRFLALCSHEYFHAWWIKTIKPASFHELDMSRENYTEQLWIFEGFTSYYDELSLLRTGILSIEQYLTLLAPTISRMHKGRGRFKQSVAQSSFDAWTKFYQQDENAPNAIVSYYTKGALLAFVLDIEIRKRTDDKHSLDDVLRLIWDNYQATGLEDDTVQTVIKHLTQSDFTQFFDAYLYGVDELPLKEAFEYVGVSCEFSHKKDDLSKLGIGINTTQEYAVITCILDASCAQTAGLYVGDKIISINNNKVLAKDLEKILGACSEGDSIKINILRDELSSDIQLTIAFGNKTHCTLTLDTRVNQAILNQQKQWIYCN
ncbi:M61 family metallopeptidase [bacterium endosymbiont of Bathymodiolus sp. 5 South]|uniref:M61 family metallopeptidase n=1 Tax=bacterium endosymbiont of Bathymodiolus sp. 5 South TaxID=1181670 RepID=UPI0010BAC9D8|nr:PDZ domain-containing protein [bacterium endosymbiont of Bathymodiolus sp. 5 South]SSC08980.1 protease, putative [bacterium endosymbiont of Bathymodiolus sp. 5 South]